MFSFRNCRQPNDHDADGYRAGEQDGKAAPLSPGIAVAATVFVQIRDWSRNCLTSLLVGHNMRDVPSPKAATVIATHHHFDHVGGLRYAAAEGAKLMVSSLALPFYEKVFANPNTIHPDQLAKSGRKPILVGVDEGTVLSDDTQKIEIYEVRESSHSRGLLMVYVPKDRILIEADEFQIPPGAAALPLPIGSEINLVENLNRLKLLVDTILPLHSHALTGRELRVRTERPIQR